MTGAGDLFAAGFLHGHVNNMSLKESLDKGTEMSSKSYTANRCETLRIFNFFFLLKLPLPFFGLITLGLYLGVIKSLAIEFFFTK